MKDIFQVIKKVRLTEKADLLNSDPKGATQVVLEVDPRANKFEIKRAVETVLGKSVTAVRTANYDGKARRKRRSDSGTTKSWKKAVVRLKKGESLDLI